MGKITQDLDTFRMPVTLQDRNRRQSGGEDDRGGRNIFGIRHGNVRQAEERWSLDPKDQVLRFDDDMRVAVAIKRGEQFMEVGEYIEAPEGISKRRWT